MARRARDKVKKIVVKEFYKCGRCEMNFKSMLSLKRHSTKAHLKGLEELKLLQQGHVPVETKFGSVFKGKNKIIIS